FIIFIISVMRVCSYLHSFPTRRSSDLFTFDINNELFSDLQRQQLRDQFGAAITEVGAYIGKRNVEGGGRQDTLEHSSYRIVAGVDRKSTRLNSSHVKISYAVFCLKKKN